MRNTKRVGFMAFLLINSISLHRMHALVCYLVHMGFQPRTRFFCALVPASTCECSKKLVEKKKPNTHACVEQVFVTKYSSA